MSAHVPARSAFLALASITLTNLACRTQHEPAPAHAPHPSHRASKLDIDPPAAPRGYRYQDGEFQGRFEDRALNSLDVLALGDSYIARLDFLRTWAIEARLEQGRLVGKATSAGLEATFSAHFEAEKLVVRLGEQQLGLVRTVDLVPAITDLGPPRTDPERQWTIAVYLGGDNDLEASALADLDEICRSVPARGVDVVVLLDRARGFDQSHGDWTDARILHARHGEAEPLLLENLGELDTGDPRTLASFVAGAFRAFPAPKHAVVLWDHGGGWTGMITDHDVPGAQDQHSKLGLDSIRVALRTGLLHAAVNQLDLLLIDACLMAQVEVALDLDPIVAYLVASQARVPTDGFPYAELLPLFAERDLGVRDLAVRASEIVTESYAAVHDPTTTASAIDVAAVPALAEALDTLAAACLPSLDQHWPAVARALYYGESDDPRFQRTGAEAACSVDIVDVLHRLQRGMHPFPARKELALVEEGLARAVLRSTTGDLRRLSHGMSVFGPRRKEQLLARYASTAFGRGNRWAQLLERTHTLAQAGAKEPVTFTDVHLKGIADRSTPTIQPCDGQTLSFTLTGNSVVSLEQRDLVRDGDGYVILRASWIPDARWMSRARAGAAEDVDLFMPEFVDGRNELSVELTGLQFLVASPTGAVRATLDTTWPSSQAPIVAHGELRQSAKEPWKAVEIFFDRCWWSPQAVYDLTAIDNGVPRTITPREQAQVRFTLQTVDDAGNYDQVLTEALDWGQGPVLILSLDEPGSYRTEIYADTLDGREYSTSIDYDVEENLDLEDWSDSWAGFEPPSLAGGWRRAIAQAPGRFLDVDQPTTIELPDNPLKGIYRVALETGPANERETLHQTWIFDPRGVPSLRIIQPVEGNRNYAVYGPVARGEDGGCDALSFKAINVGGTLWRWTRCEIDALRLPDEPK